MACIGTTGLSVLCVRLGLTHISEIGTGREEVWKPFWPLQMGTLLSVPYNRHCTTFQFRTERAPPTPPADGHACTGKSTVVEGTRGGGWRDYVTTWHMLSYSSKRPVFSKIMSVKDKRQILRRGECMTVWSHAALSANKIPFRSSSGVGDSLFPLWQAVWVIVHSVEIVHLQAAAKIERDTPRKLFHIKVHVQRVCRRAQRKVPRDTFSRPYMVLGCSMMVDINCWFLQVLNPVCITYLRIHLFNSGAMYIHRICRRSMLIPARMGGSPYKGYV